MKKVKKSCYYCKYRQRERIPRPEYVCVLNEKIVDKDYSCSCFEKRWSELTETNGDELLLS